MVPGRAGPVRGGGAVGQRGRGCRPPLPPRQRRPQPRRPRNLLLGLARRAGHLTGLQNETYMKMGRLNLDEIC